MIAIPPEVVEEFLISNTKEGAEDGAESHARGVVLPRRHGAKGLWDLMARGSRRLK